MELASLVPLTDRLGAAYLEYYGLLPLGRAGVEPAGGGAGVGGAGAATDPTMRVATWREHPDPQALDDLRLAFGTELELVPGPEADLRAAIRRVYATGAVTAEQVIAEMPDDRSGGVTGEMPLDDLVHLANEAPVVKLVNLLLLEALEARASDVHLEASSHGQRVRYRVDGVMQEAPSPPAHLAAAVVSRLKIMAELDIAERRVPQDGRIRLKLQDRQVDVRVSTVPTLHGESIVLRLLDKEQHHGALEALGMAPGTLTRFERAIARPHGIVLATGPTGSGKTTTLYAALDRLRTGREKILTVEDPVEYELAGIAQVPVNEKVGVTFATALRALLRQDPDVMLVGEIRDKETAEIATHAALTGHLVLSTLHTNDAPSAITRLVDLGVAPYLVASTVEAVLAQRLVRVLCTQCRKPVEPTAELRAVLGDDTPVICSAAGCERCRGTGFRGRTGIYELVWMDDDLRALVVGQRQAGEIRRLANEKGMGTLRDDGLRQVRAWMTTVEEVLRVTETGSLEERLPSARPVSLPDRRSESGGPGLRDPGVVHSPACSRSGPHDR
ncbi:MAG TPA: ATPase, T2SS/T4P/T4SS family [Gemmatimonadales bacterium]|jgi:general secretion pathway protein E|nr:ATPase, T2SS/T4P/T4SS family [Gemmatimonadales bacterium]